MYACSFLYFLLVFFWQAEALKRKTKGAAALKPAAARGGGSSVGEDGYSSVQAQARRWDTTWCAALDLARFYWSGQGARCARACEEYLTQRKYGGPCFIEFNEFFELIIQTVSTEAPPHHAHTGAPAAAYM